MHYFCRAHLTPAGIQSLKQNEVGQYGIHRLVWNLFPDIDGSPRPFIYAWMENEHNLYCVSEIVPVDDDGRWTIDVKEYEPKVNNGDVLRFRIQANPTVANSKTGKHARHDVVMDLKLKRRSQGGSVDINDLLRDSVIPWFKRKGSLNGFEILSDEDVIVHSYKRHESLKNRSQKITFSSVVIEGCLKVTDSALFTDCLIKGIGSAKGFGCGMMMVRRP